MYCCSNLGSIYAKGQSHVRQRETFYGTLLRTFPFLVDPGTSIPIKYDLPTLGKRSANYLAHAKQDETVICKILFKTFSDLN